MPLFGTTLTILKPKLTRYIHEKTVPAIGMTLLCAGSAHAGSAFFDFNSDLLPMDCSQITATRHGVPSTAPGVTNANDGYLVITGGSGGQRGTIIFADVDNGQVVKAFTFEADLRIGNGTQIPLTVSASIMPGPVTLSCNPPMAAAPIRPVSLPVHNAKAICLRKELKPGIAIGFDAWDSGGSAPYCDGLGVASASNIGPDVIGISVRVDKNWFPKSPRQLKMALSPIRPRSKRVLMTQISRAPRLRSVGHT